MQGAESAKAYNHKTMPDLDAPGPSVPVCAAEGHAGGLQSEGGVRLEVSWSRRGANFRESLHAVLRGPTPPKGFDGGPYFRDCWVASRWPKRAFVAALAVQVALVLLHPNWSLGTPQPTTVEADLTWYSPAEDLPQIAPGEPKEKISPAPEQKEPLPRAGADAYHPRQTILSAPLHPTHPRQVLIQPNAPDVAPKILPALPNIVKWADESAQPQLSLAQQALAQLHPAAPQTRQTQTVAAPDLADPPVEAGPVNIAEVPTADVKPSMTIQRMSAGRAAARRAEANTAAPDVAANIGGDPGHVIAISATPGPPAPPPVVPQGNLTARVSISPEGQQPGTPGGAANGTAGTATVPGGGHGPVVPGISISGGAPNSHASVSGAGSGTGHGAGTPEVAARSVRSSPPSAPGATPTPANFAALGPDARPEVLLGPREVYTLNINMPNLTSATGSWIISFAELDEGDSHSLGRPVRAALARPEPLRKVDPRYPQDLRAQRVEGEVILYAVIRKDGSVDSIQLVRGVDPELDQDAMEALAGWKFRPAEREGAPVEVAAIVRIPFRAVAPER